LGPTAGWGPTGGAGWVGVPRVFFFEDAPLFSAALFFAEGVFLGLADFLQGGGALFGNEDCAVFLRYDVWVIGWRGIGLIGLGPATAGGQTGWIEEALEFGGQPEASELVGHPDIGGAVAGLLDARAEVAGRGDLTGWGTDDAGEELVDFAQLEGDAGGAGLLDGLDAGGDGFPAQETVAAAGGDMAVLAGRAVRAGRAVLRAVDVHVGLGGVFA